MVSNRDMVEISWGLFKDIDIYIYDDILMDIQSGVIKCGTTKENG